MRILFYQPYNQIVVYIESILEQFARQGHETFFLSHAEKGATHINLEKFGCKTFSLPVKRRNFFQYYYRRIKILISFCKKNDIDIVYSHFQEANIIAVFAQLFHRAIFVITRHHSDCGFLDSNFKERWADRIINRLTKIYIAPSKKVYDQIVKVEGTDPTKVFLINYGYNFNAFDRIDLEETENIKSKYSSNLLIVMAARLIKEKRHYELIEAARIIKSKGIEFKILLLGKGPLYFHVADKISAEFLEENIFLLGFKQNILDYYAAAQLVVHFSETEASNSAIKEAAIADTPVAVCHDVGDFDDYIINNVNGFLLNKSNPIDEFVQIVEGINSGRYDLKAMGMKLHKDVIQRFDISNVINSYTLFNSMVNKK